MSQSSISVFVTGPVEIFNIPYQKSQISSLYSIHKQHICVSIGTRLFPAENSMNIYYRHSYIKQSVTWNERTLTFSLPTEPSFACQSGPCEQAHKTNNNWKGGNNSSRHSLILVESLAYTSPLRSLHCSLPTFCFKITL